MHKMIPADENPTVPVNKIITIKPMKYNKKHIYMYRKTSNIRRTLVGNNIVDHLDVVGALPVGAAPTISS